ncbi:MAG: hypothetical protein N2C13_02625 [Chloroflexota bacterium]
MSTTNDDLTYLSWVAEELKAYLLSNELYWPSGARFSSGNTPSNPITPGNLLFAQTMLEIRLQAGELDSKNEAEFKEVSQQIDAIQQEWRSAWENKVSRDLQSRLRQWIDKLDEIGKMGGDLSAYYSSAVRERVLITLLADELSGDTFPEAELLAIQDQRLRKISSESEFVWEEKLEGGFDKTKHWYLYRHPV